MSQRLRFMKAVSGLLLLLIASITSIVYAHPTLLQHQQASIWSTKDIGAARHKGSLVSSGDVFTVKGYGSDIGGTHDQFYYVYTSLIGDGQLVADLVSQDVTDNAAKAGLMLRGTLADGAANVFLAQTPRSGIALQWRGASGETTHHGAGLQKKVPLWMKLVRQNDRVTGWTSSDGSQWREVTSVTIKMAATVSLGFAVTSHNETRLSQAVFTHVIFAEKAVPSTPTSLPSTPVPTPVPIPAVSDKATRVYGQGDDFSSASINVNAESLDTPSGVAVDSSGNRYIADSGNNRVLYYPAGSTTATRVYGQAGSLSTNVLSAGANGLNNPDEVLLDSAGNLYIVDEGNNRVLYYPAGSTTATRVYGQGGSFLDISDNNGGVSAASLNTPNGIALDSSGDLYIVDALNNRVLYYPAGSTTATRVYGQAGSFTTNAVNIGVNGLNNPNGVAVDSSGNVYIADTGNNRVLYYPVGSTTATRVYGQRGSFTVIAANNSGVSAASLNNPNEVAVDSSGNLYIADTGNNRMLYYPAGSTMATQVYGQEGSFTTNKANVGATGLKNPMGVAVDGSGNIDIVDTGNNRVLYYTAGSMTATQVYGQRGSFTANVSNVSIDSLNAPFGVAVDESDNLYVADAGNNRVLYYPVGSTTATRVYGQGGSFTTNAGKGERISAESLNSPDEVVLDSKEGLYIADAGNNRVLYYPAGSTTATRVYGQQGSFTTNRSNNGGVSAESLNSPDGVALDSKEGLYIADAGNNRVLYYPAGSTTATRVYGQQESFTRNDPNNGGISAHSINYPNGGMALDSSGNLYVADTGNSRVLYYPAGSVIATRVYGQRGSFATNEVNMGGVSATNFTYPDGVALDSSGSLYVADILNNRVLYYPAGSTTATHVYGQGGSFITGWMNRGGVSATSLNIPLGVAIDKRGNLYVVDDTNNRVLMFPLYTK